MIGTPVQRTAFTALVSMMIWPIILGWIGHPLIRVMKNNLTITGTMEVSLLLSVLMGIWCVSPLGNWSKAATPLTGLKATGIRLLIAAITAAIFCVFYSTFLSSSGVPFSYGEALQAQGIFVTPAVWIAATLADLLLRDHTRDR